jgi:hypothetical protein
MQVVIVGLTVPILFSNDVLCLVREGARQSKEIEKRNKEIGDKEKLTGTRYAAPYAD